MAGGEKAGTRAGGCQSTQISPPCPVSCLPPGGAQGWTAGEEAGARQVLGGSWRVPVHTGHPHSTSSLLSRLVVLRGGRCPVAVSELQSSARDSAGVSLQASAPGPLTLSTLEWGP